MVKENTAKLAKAESALREAILATSPSTTDAGGLVGVNQGTLSHLPSAEHSYSTSAQDSATVPVGSKAGVDVQVTLETASPAISLTLVALNNHCGMLTQALEEAEAKLGRVTSITVSEIPLERLCVVK